MNSQDYRNLQEAYLNVYQEIDEATRMRKELGKEGEIETRKELARRSNEYQRSGSVDKTIAAAERGADRPYVANIRGESDADRAARQREKSKTLERLAISRRSSVRDKPRAGLRGYAANVKGSDKELRNARSSAMAAGTLTPNERKQLNMEFDFYDIILSHLLDEGYADTEDSALVIMANMSEDWRESICEDYKPWDFGPKQKAKRKYDQLVKDKAAGNSPPGTATRANKIASVAKDMRTTLDKNSASTGTNPAKQGLQPATRRHTAAALRGAGGGMTASKTYDVKPLNRR
jgi:hypothetical protein